MKKEKLANLIMLMDLKIASYEQIISAEGMKLMVALQREFKDIHKAARSAVKRLSKEELE